MKIILMLAALLFISCSNQKQKAQFQESMVKDFVDADQDGIDDVDDKCLKTAKGALVNGYGCEEQEKVQFTFDIEFAANSADIPKEFEQELEHLAMFMLKHPKTRALIEGHSDALEGKSTIKIKVKKRKYISKTIETNTISLARAEAVRNYLIEKFGIDSARLTTIGYASKKPLAENNTAEGRKMNRRVSAVIQSVQNN